MESVLFSDLAFGRVPLILLMLVMDIFLLVRKPGNVREWMFFAHFFFMTLFSIGYFIAFSVYSPLANIGWVIASLSVFALPAHIQFGYRFPRKMAPVESSIVLVISLALSFWGIIDYVVRVGLADIRLTENGYGTTYQSILLPVIMAALCLWRIVVFCRQTIRCSSYEGTILTEKPEENPGLVSLARSAAAAGVKLIRPKGKSAKAAQGFMIMTSIEFLLALTVALHAATNIISQFAITLILNISFTVIYLIYVILYINRSPKSYSLIYKIAGVTLVNILIIVMALGYHSVIMEQRAYEELKTAQTKAILHCPLSSAEGDLPADCSFIFKAERGKSPILIFSRDETTGPFDIGGLISRPEGERIFYQHEMKNYYCFTAGRGADRIIAVYDIRSFRKTIHRAVTVQIIIVLISIALVLLLYPFLLSFSFITPVRDLLRGVERVRSNDLKKPVPIHFEDEIGEVSRSFNMMMRSVQSSRRMVKDYTDHLEDIVSLRTEELSSAIETIKETQDRLIQTEKMASLGNLVAGIAHEINTPIGIALTASTHLQSVINDTTVRYSSGTMKKSDFEKFMSSAAESAVIIEKNIERASSVVQGFKQVAVDRSDDRMRLFNIGTYLGDVLLSLQPQIRKTKTSLSVSGNPDLEIFSDPGAFAQVFSNLIINSLTHAFEAAGGAIDISYRKENEDIIFTFSDDGKGISKEILPRIFDPFFTTRRGDGGTGLGLHIVYNIVAQKFGGKIDAVSEVGKGTVFTIRIPANRKGEES